MSDHRSHGQRFEDAMKAVPPLVTSSPVISEAVDTACNALASFLLFQETMSGHRIGDYEQIVFEVEKGDVEMEIIVRRKAK